MNCQKCGRQLVKLDRRLEMAEADEDVTEGQMADYFAAEESGEYGAWSLAIIEYECRHCKTFYQIQGEELNSYKKLILSWHQKALENDDPFSSFVFEYLAFIAHLKNNLFYETEKDRDAIQWLKQNEDRKNKYLNHISADTHLRITWNKIIKELRERPLHNSSHDLDNPEIDKWWNSDGNGPNRDTQTPRGMVHSTSDWSNMLEFWCGVRNNLFHGGKSPDFERDCFLVEHAFITLKEFMDLEMSEFYAHES